MRVAAGSTDVSVIIRIVDAADGTPETGVVAATPGLALWYWRENAAAIVGLTESNLATLDAAHSDGGLLHIGDGWYRVDLPDAAFAAGVGRVLIGGAATDMVVIGQLVEIGPVIANVTTMASGVVTAAAIATDAIDADALAADAIAEINATVDTAISDAALATAANLAIVAGYLDTEIAAIKAVTDAIPDAGALTALLASIADLPTNAELTAALAALATQVSVDDLPTNAELTTALGTADDAVLAAIAALNDPTAAAIATAVWSAVTRTLTSGGGGGGASAADIWSYHVRTLTGLVAAWAGESLSLVRGVTFGANLSGLSIPATWTELYFTAKTSPSATDATAAVQIKVSNPGDAGDGLLFLAGAAGTAAWGSLTADATLGTIAIALQDDATALLTAGTYGYDVKVLLADGSSQLLTEGALAVRLTETETLG